MQPNEALDRIAEAWVNASNDMRNARSKRLGEILQAKADGVLLALTVALNDKSRTRDRALDYIQDYLKRKIKQKKLVSA
jgi:hypothetical protein